MTVKGSTVRRISVETARKILGDLRVGDLEKAGKRHGIKNYQTIPLLIRRAYEREGLSVPRLPKRLAVGGGRNETVRVNRKGTIVIPRDIVVGLLGLKTGQRFTARRWGRKIVLTVDGTGPVKQKAARGKRASR